MILLDTGYLAALLDNRDVLHERALAWAKWASAKSVSEPLLVTEFVLIETANLLSSSVERARLHLLVQHVISTATYDFVWSDRKRVEAALELHRERPDKQWSVTDCASFLVMQERGITRALAYDHHFEQAGFEALLRRDP